jgi:DNA-binding transcriptional ArsR family regulator
MEQRLHELETQLAAVVARLVELEQRIPSRADHLIASALPRSASFAEQLVQRLEAARSSGEDVLGFVAYAGAVRAPEGELVWDRERSASELLGLELEPVAHVLAALGHSVRLELMRLLLRGPQSSQQLQEALGLNSSGTLYYHIKELLAAGLVTQPSRNLYQVSAQRIIPFLAILVAGLDVNGG